MKIHDIFTGILAALILGVAFILMIPGILFIAAVKQVFEWVAR